MDNLSSVLFFSRPRSEGWPRIPWTYFLQLSLTSVTVRFIGTVCVRSRLCVTVRCPSVRLSVCLSRHSAAAAACGGFAAERRVGTVQPAAAAPRHGGQQQMRAVPRRQLGRLQLLSDICCRAELSSKPAARRCSCRSTGQTDRRTDGRTDTGPLRRLCRLDSVWCMQCRSAMIADCDEGTSGENSRAVATRLPTLLQALFTQTATSGCEPAFVCLSVCASTAAI